jgi:glycosyltransferase involved in cell wall biosynthesis
MEFRPYYMASKWREAKHEVTVIAGSFSHVRQKQPEKLGWRKVDGIDYLWLWTNRYAGNGLKRFLGMLVFVLQLLIRVPILTLKLKPDVVIASSTYPLDIFPAYFLAKLSGAKLIFEIHDLWPLSPMELGGMSRYHPFIVIMRIGEWFAHKFSDKILSIIPNTFEHVAKDGVKKENFLYIPNGVNLEDVKSFTPIPNDLRKLIKQHKKGKIFLIGYAGSIGIANDIRNLINAAELLSDSEVHFFIIGSGTESEILKACNIKNVTFYKKIPKNTVNSFLRNMDLLYLGFRKYKLYNSGISQNKLYDYMLSGKPIIQAVNANENLIKEAECGWTVPMEDPIALANMIKKIIKMPKAELKRFGENAKKYVVINHDYKVLASKFLEFILK